MWMSAVELASLALTFPATPCRRSRDAGKGVFAGNSRRKGVILTQNIELFLPKHDKVAPAFCPAYRAAQQHKKNFLQWIRLGALHAGIRHGPKVLLKFLCHLRPHCQSFLENNAQFMTSRQSFFSGTALLWSAIWARRARCCARKTGLRQAFYNLRKLNLGISSCLPTLQAPLPPLP